MKIIYAMLIGTVTTFYALAGSNSEFRPSSPDGSEEELTPAHILLQKQVP